MRRVLRWGSGDPDLGEKEGNQELPTTKFPTKIMVWGTISVAGKNRLHFVDGTVNIDVYTGILEAECLPFRTRHLSCILKSLLDSLA